MLATHADNRYMSDNIHALRAKLLDSPFPDAVLKSNRITFMHGQNDTVATAEHANKMAKHMDAPIVIMKNTFHAPYTKERLTHMFASLFNAVALTSEKALKPQPTARTPFEYARTLVSNFPSMLHNLRGNMAIGQRLPHVRLPRLRFPTNK
jgi:hypothetical protein